MVSDFVKGITIAALGGIAPILSVFLFFIRASEYVPDTSMQIIGGASLIFPAVAYIYIYEKYRDVFWKSFFVGTILMFAIMFTILFIFSSSPQQ